MLLVVITRNRRSDPTWFLAGLNGPVPIDEVWRALELSLPIMVAVGRNRARGRFLLTGSANVRALKDDRGLARRAETQNATLAPAPIGGFPPALARKEITRRRAWFASHLTTKLDRNVRDRAAIEGVSALPNLLGLLAAGSGGLVISSNFAAALARSQSTVKAFVTLLKRLFLVRELPAWSKNLTLRLTTSPRSFSATRPRDLRDARTAEARLGEHA